MFTGIVEHIGAIRSVVESAASDTGRRLGIDLGPVAEGACVGDSISVCGCCLTITAQAGSVAAFDVGAETLRKTAIGSWAIGRSVNLERALAFGGRMGGHLVSGHIDGVGSLQARVREGDSERFTFILPDDGSVIAVEKGSIAIDGVSLTTWDCDARRCSVSLIPHTLTHTTLGALAVGDRVQLEQDVVGRWVQTLLARSASGMQVGRR